LPLHDFFFSFKGRYEHPKIWDSKSPNFGTPIWESWEKMSFGYSPYKEPLNIL
jgi:hypothetical protein